MSLEPFSKSEVLTFDVELESWLVNRHDYSFASVSPGLLHMLKNKEYSGDIKPEIADSMIEISIDTCHSHDETL